MSDSGKSVRWWRWSDRIFKTVDAQQEAIEDLRYMGWEECTAPGDPLPQQEATRATYRDLAETAVVALHMHNRANGLHHRDFKECRNDLCGDWHKLEAATPTAGAEEASIEKLREYLRGSASEQVAEEMTDIFSRVLADLDRAEMACELKAKEVARLTAELADTRNDGVERLKQAIAERDEANRKSQMWSEELAEAKRTIEKLIAEVQVLRSHNR